MSDINNQNKINILLVEDCLEDFTATKRAFQSQGDLFNIFHCEDGDDAIDFIRQQGKFSDENKSPRPNMVLLDLNLPGTDGKDVLRDIKVSETHKHIPIVIFSTSSNPQDISECYQIGANGYLQKPMEYFRFVDLIQEFKNYWFQTSFLPNQSL